jgi:hypothetical protein
VQFDKLLSLFLRALTDRQNTILFDLKSPILSGIFPSVELIDLFSQQLIKNEETRCRTQEMTDIEIGEENSFSTGSESVQGLNEDESEGGSEGEIVVRAPSSIVITPAPTPTAAAKRVESKYYNSALGSDGTRLALLVQRFVECSKLDGRYYLCDHDNCMLVSNWLHTIPLTLPERSAPFSTLPYSYSCSCCFIHALHFDHDCFRTHVESCISSHRLSHLT